MNIPRSSSTSPANPSGPPNRETLRLSLNVIREQVESMGKAHQSIAQQMKTELEEPLTAFAGGLKERRKIVQGGIEKLLKTKMQQTAQVQQVARSIRAGLSEDQRLPCAGAHGHGSRRAEEQG